MASFNAHYQTFPLNDQNTVQAAIGSENDNIVLVISSYVTARREPDSDLTPPKELRLFRIKYQTFLEKIVPQLVQAIAYMKQTRSKILTHEKHPHGLIVQTYAAPRTCLDMRFYSSVRSNKTREEIAADIKASSGIAFNCLSHNGCRLSIHETQNLLRALPGLDQDFQNLAREYEAVNAQKNQQMKTLTDFLDNSNVCNKYKQDIINALK